jgi:ribosomal protein L15E
MAKYYKGVLVQELEPAGKADPQFIQVTKRMGTGRSRGKTRGGWVTENESIRIRKELKAKNKKNRKKKGNRSRK